METPNFYAIISADVRYSKNINANEKLLYAEITALTQSTGICWASNIYFAGLFNCTPQAISKWVKNLEKNGFLVCEYEYEKGSKEVKKRLIKVSTTVEGGINNGIKGINHSLGGYQHTIKENNTRDNNKKINKKEILLEEYKNKYPEATEKVISILEDFISYRKQIGKPIKTIHGLIGYGKKLRELAEDGKDIYEAIKKMKDNEWQTVY